MNYKDELYLEHFGVIGMKWGQRRSQKLSKKFGIKVDEGISSRKVKKLIKGSEIQKDRMRRQVIEDHANKTIGYYDIVGVKKMSQKQYDSITNKANKTLDAIDKLKISEIKSVVEKGKKKVEVILK